MRGGAALPQQLLETGGTHPAELAGLGAGAVEHRDLEVVDRDRPVVRVGGVPEGSDREHVEKAPQAFDIDMLRCIYCGLCQEVCPEEAIFLQNQYSMSGYTRAEMVNHKDRLYELGGTLPDEHYKWDKKKAAEEHGNAH